MRIRENNTINSVIVQFTNAQGGFSGFDGFDFSDYGDIMEEVLKNFGFRTSSSRGWKKRKQAGSDLLYRMTVTFEEAVHGSKEISK